MIDTRKIAENIVKITNKCDNDYDAVDFVQNYLDEEFNIKKDIVKTPIEDGSTEEHR